MKQIALKYTAAFFFAAALVIACQKNIEEPVVNEDPIEETTVQPKMMTVSCTIETPSKVTLTNDGTKGKTEWEMTDEVLFHGKYIGAPNYSCVVNPTSISADGKIAYFTIPELDEEYDGSADGYQSSLFAIYPASAVYDYSNGDNWRYVQTFKETNHLLLVGYNKPTAEDTDRAHFKFINLSGALSFKVNKGELDFDEYKVLGNNNEIVGYSKYSVTAAFCTGGWPEHRTKYESGSGAGATSGPMTVLDITPTDPDWANGTTINTVFFPNGVHFTSGFTILFLKDGVEVKRVSTNTEKNIAIGKYLDLGDISTHLYTYVAPSTHDAEHPAITGAEDLGAVKTANCYIVDASVDSNAEKVFKFKAYKGNSTIGVGAISSATVLWETYNNDTAPTMNSVIAEVDFDKQEANDYYEICFKMPETLHAGNAVIAAKDAGGNILWSWHIWVPSTTITTNTHGIYPQALMDRNLGALIPTEVGSVAAVESFGLLYQWGRKDPFPGAKRNNSSSRALVVGVATSSTEGTGDGNDDSKITLAQSIANPTLLGHKQGGDWLTPSDQLLWKNAEKTMYDPCPPGYRVPARDKSSVLHSADLSIAVGWEDNTENKYFTIGDPVAVFPYTGYYDTWSSSLSSVSSYGKRTVLWTAYSSSDEIAYEEAIRTATDGDRHKLEEVGKCNTSSVRCCVE